MEANVVQMLGPDSLAQRQPVAPSQPARPAPEESDDVGIGKPRKEADVVRLLGSGSASQGLRRTYAKFVVDHDTSDVSVQIINADTQEVIRRIPSADLADLARAQLRGSGLLVDDRA